MLELSISSRMAPSRVLLLLDLDLHFQGQNCWHFILLTNISQMVKDKENFIITFR